MLLWPTRYMTVYFFQTFHFVAQPCSLEAISGLEIWSGEQTIAETLYHLYTLLLLDRETTVLLDTDVLYENTKENLSF